MPEQTIQVRIPLFRADISAIARIGTDRAGNQVLCLRVVLLEGADLGATRGLLDEPAPFVVHVDSHGLAWLCRRAQMNSSRVAKSGPLTAHAVVSSPRLRRTP